MSKKKGAEKTGGRKKGTPNKVTTDLRTWVNDLLVNNQATFTEDLKQVEPYQRLAVMEKLLSFVVPKLQNTALDIDFNKLTDEQLNKIITEITERN
jgi:hypothetical protein